MPGEGFEPPTFGLQTMAPTPFSSSLRTLTGWPDDIRAIGFRTADQIVAKLGIEKTALIRVRAGIVYALTEVRDEGHCGPSAEELISFTQTRLKVPVKLVKTTLGMELENGAVIADDLEGHRCVFLAGLPGPSRKSRKSLEALAIGKPPWPAIDADKAIPGSSGRRSWRSPIASERLFASLSFPKC